MIENKTVPVISYNGGNYDLTFVLNAMAKRNLLPTGVISNGSSYKRIQMIQRDEETDSFKRFNYHFIDLMNFAPAGCSLDRFCKMWGVSTSKGIFPYEWFDNISKMEEKVFPPYESFFSTLKNSNIPREDYDREKQMFDEDVAENNFDFGDYMMYYCVKDVDIMIEAANNMREMFQEKEGIEALSLLTAPSIAYTALKVRKETY